MNAKIISFVSSLNPTVTFEAGRPIISPKSKVKSPDVLFLPSSIIASSMMRLLLVIAVTLPITSRSPMTRAPPETTRTLDPVSSMYRFDPTLKVWPGVEFAIPTFDWVTRAVVLLTKLTTLAVTLPWFVTAANPWLPIRSEALSPDSTSSLVSVLYIISTTVGLDA